MGLFDFFKKSKPVVPKQEPKKTAVLETDRKYYQDDSYYTDVAFSGTPFETRVVSFEERKRTAIPSRTVPGRGAIAGILLLRNLPRSEKWLSGLLVV